MDITTEFGDGLTKRSGEKGGRKNRPAAARNLPPPFPGQRVYGTDPRRQGYVAGDILQKRENFSRHRVAPLTAPVPFRKTRCTSGKGGECKGAGSPANAGLDGQTIRPVRYGGSAPATPHAKKSKLSLDGRGPSHGSRDGNGAVSGARKIEFCAGSRLLNAVTHGLGSTRRVSARFVISNESGRRSNTVGRGRTGWLCHPGWRTGTPAATGNRSRCSE